jgi:hypothetical protein
MPSFKCATIMPLLIQSLPAWLKLMRTTQPHLLSKFSLEKLFCLCDNLLDLMMPKARRSPSELPVSIVILAPWPLQSGSVHHDE